MEDLLPEESAQLILRLGFALVLGLLVGLERGWTRQKAGDGEGTAGIRTYGVYGLFGGLAGIAPLDWILPAAIVAAAGLVAAAYATTANRPEEGHGTTSEVAVLATVVIGGLAGRGEMVVSAAATVLLLLILSSKPQMHRFLNMVRHDEIRAAVRLLVLSVLVLPFLPNEPMGPGGVLNPYEIWWAVILVAGLSFAGYIAVRVLGGRNGPLAFGVFGGLASSTAVTVTSARLAKKNPELASTFAGAIGLSSAVMLARVGVLTLTFAPPLFAAIWPVLAVTAGASVVAALALALRLGAKRKDGDSEELTMETPDDIWFAVIFGALLAGIGLAAFYARETFGDAGVYALAMVSGLVDVDAFSLSMARSGQAEEGVGVAASAVLLCVAVNTLVKFGIAAGAGGAALTARVGVIVAASLAAGFAAWLVFPVS